MKSLEYLHVGRLVGTHGVKGEVRVLPETDFQEVRFAPGAKLYLQHESEQTPLPLTIEKSRPHKRVLLVQFAEWKDIQQAEPYRNGRLVVPIEQIVESEEEGEYYYHEIIGCEVVTENGEKIGRVQEIQPYPAHDIWVVRSHERKQDILLPYIREIVKEIDLANQRITIAWMEGLG